MDSTYKLRFVSLGGIIGVTKNMYLYELYRGEELQDIVIVDCGIGFPQDKALGVDFVIPDISYLKDKLGKIRAILLSHGHEDHISALPYYYTDLGEPPMYASKLTSAFIKNKFKETGQEPKINLVDFDQRYKFGGITAEFVRMTHSIPDTTHILLRTPAGNIYHGSDFKLDLTPPYGSPPDFYKITQFGHEGAMCLMSDCLGSDREGLTLSENIVGQTFEDQMRKTKGKFIMSTFSSNISRIRQCVEAAKKFNRKVAFMGRSMRDNTAMAAEIGYLPELRDLLIKDDQVMRLAPNKVCLIVAGSQGQYNSALAKLASKQHKFIQVKPGDAVVFSSDPIPGNENEVYGIIEDLVLLGADVIYPDVQEQLHASGHGNQEDIKFLARFVDPKYFIPIGGTIRHQRGYQNLISDMGYKKENILLLDEGDTVIFEKGIARKGQNIPTKTIYVDAYGVGDVGSVILRDRQIISTDGMVVALVLLDKNNQLLTKPSIISRGFVFEKREEQLMNEATTMIEAVLKSKEGLSPSSSNLKKEIADKLEQLFLESKGRKPLVVVEVIQV
jgi:ribonuclease J